MYLWIPSFRIECWLKWSNIQTSDSVNSWPWCVIMRYYILWSRLVWVTYHTLLILLILPLHAYLLENFHTFHTIHYCELLCTKKLFKQYSILLELCYILVISLCKGEVKFQTINYVCMYLYSKFCRFSIF